MNRSDSALLAGGPRSLTLSTSLAGPADAPPVLVLHGITASRRYWIPRILSLATRYRLLIPDLPGFGQSPKPFVDYTMDFFVESLLGLLEQQGLAGRPLGVIGHSLGALLAVELGARQPGLVERAVLLNVPRFRDPETAHRIMLGGSASYRSLLTVNSVSASWTQLRRTGWRLTARYVRRLPWAVVVDSRKFSFRSLSSTLEHCVLHHDLDVALTRFPPSVPCLLIHGDRDQVAPLEPIHELCSRPPFPRLCVVRGAGHNPFHTHGADCLRAMTEFLDAP